MMVGQVHNLVADNGAQAFSVKAEEVIARLLRVPLSRQDQLQKCERHAFGGIGRVGHGGCLRGSGGSSFRLFYASAPFRCPPICHRLIKRYLLNAGGLARRVAAFVTPARFPLYQSTYLPLPAGSPKDQAGERATADDFSPSSAGRVSSAVFFCRNQVVRFRTLVIADIVRFALCSLASSGPEAA